MTEPVNIALRLKSLRELSGLSVRAMADELGMPQSTYAHYENRFKKDFLPMDVAQRIAIVLARHNIPESQVLALAGTPGLAEPEAQAFRSPPRSRARDVLESLDKPQIDPPHQVEIKIAVVGKLAQIVATVDRAALASLRRKLDAIEAMLDDE